MHLDLARLDVMRLFISLVMALYRSLLASRSDSNRTKMSSVSTGYASVSQIFEPDKHGRAKLRSAYNDRCQMNTGYLQRLSKCAPHIKLQEQQVQQESTPFKIVQLYIAPEPRRSRSSCPAIVKMVGRLEEIGRRTAVMSSRG